MTDQAIVVGETEISAHSVGLEAQYHPAGSWEEAEHEAKRALVVRELLLFECARRGIQNERPRDERAAQGAIEALLDTALPAATIDEAACRAYYDAHPREFMGEPLFDASHILLAAARNDEASRAIARRCAEALLSELSEHPERFERRAREASGCPSAASDGRLGQVSPGETEPDFEAVLRTLCPGELCPDLVETKNGYHIVRLEARAAAQRLPFEVVQAKIRLYLEEQEFRRALHRFVAGLAAKYGVRGFDLESRAPEPKPPELKQHGPRRLPVMQA